MSPWPFHSLESIQSANQMEDFTVEKSNFWIKTGTGQHWPKCRWRKNYGKKAAHLIRSPKTLKTWKSIPSLPLLSAADWDSSTTWSHFWPRRVFNSQTNQICRPCSFHLCSIVKHPVSEWCWKTRSSILLLWDQVVYYPNRALGSQTSSLDLGEWHYFCIED